MLEKLLFNVLELFVTLAAKYGEENNEMKRSLETHYWEDEYHSLTS